MSRTAAPPSAPPPFQISFGHPLTTDFGGPLDCFILRVRCGFCYTSFCWFPVSLAIELKGCNSRTAHNPLKTTRQLGCVRFQLLFFLSVICVMTPIEAPREKREPVLSLFLLLCLFLFLNWCLRDTVKLNTFLTPL